MIIAHILGLPVEESVAQLAPTGAVTLTLAAVVGRTKLARLVTWIRRGGWKQPRS
jgi:hypothetical protein